MRVSGWTHHPLPLPEALARLMGHLAWYPAVPTLLRAATDGMSPQMEKRSIKHRFWGP